MLVVESGGTRYGIEADYIHEIITNPAVTKAPVQPDYLIGLNNYKSQVIPVLSLDKLCGSEEKDSVACIVLEYQDGLAGLAVSGLGGMVDHELVSEIDGSQMESCGYIRIKKVLEQDGLILVLDLEEMFQQLCV